MLTNTSSSIRLKLSLQGSSYVLSKGYHPSQNPSPTIPHPQTNLSCTLLLAWSIMSIVNKHQHTGNITNPTQTVAKHQEWASAVQLSPGSFYTSQDIPCHSLLLSFFDITKPTRLSTDASRQRLEFVLQ